MLICPICKTKLTREASRYVCENRHSHDISKYGHVNLLMSQKGGNHGDSREMLLSRKNFLDSGAYSPMREALTETIVQLTDGYNSVSLLDSGCGECYYTSRIKEALNSFGKNPHVIGIDISKEALRLAAQRFNGECKKVDSSVELAVASSYQLPVAECSTNVVISVFAPLCSDEFARVLKVGGYFITVIPGRRHLWELKSAIYEKPYENEIMPYEIDKFELVSKKELSGKFTLASKEAIFDLFTMTPYFCRTSEQDKTKLYSLDSLECSYEFEILVYKKS
ncbi:MAG: methyltransferase domain-containing protein [Ruminococcaceae bacterium]|nr:methyltransferase domain-containing protein [Oscillospiraceae bacterium]